MSLLDSRGKERALPPEIYIPLVDSLYKEGRTLLAGSIFVVGSVLVTYWKTGEPLLLACGIALAVVACARGIFMHAYKRLRPILQTNAEARKWEYGYVTGAATSVALLGIWCYIAFSRTADPFAHLISFSMTIAYVIGVFGRNFGSPRFVVVQICCAWLPMTAALLLHGDIYHWFFAALLVPFFIAVRFLSESLRRTLLDAIIASREMSALAHRFDTALTNMPHGICMFDRNGRILVANRRMGQILNLPPTSEIKGWSTRELIRNCIKFGTVDLPDAKRLARNLRRQFTGNGSNEQIIEARDGRTLAITSQAMNNGGAVALIQDITERRQAEAIIDRMARYDALTELPNRNLLQDRLNDVFRRRGGGEACAVHFIDLDHFKQVNDTLGHSKGDILLQAVADRLRHILRASDMAARFGGDEFVILQSPVSSPEEVSGLAKRIVKELGRPYQIDGQQAVVGASIGVALFPNDGTNIDQLLKNADMALYHAKADSRGTWKFFQPEMDKQAQERRRLELDLRNAMDSDAFEVHFQPIIDLGTGRVATCEALLRWRHPERGIVSAADFIPIAEETGAVMELGRWVLEKACLECQNWPEETSVAVNLSPLQFRGCDVPALVCETLAATGLPASRLELEITESALLQNTSTTRIALRKLQARGVKISLDDFGTGYSSLSYLHSFPLHKVKIDRSFLEDLTVRSRSLTLLSGIARLSAELGLRVTVEGVENREQLQLISRNSHVHEGQGYFIGRPVSAKQIHARLHDTSSAMVRVA
ncbi:MAG: putative bifunctional diguanylate cyclase/phosphodiesterase [Methyloligellaceae bacterium]